MKKYKILLGALFILVALPLFGQVTKPGGGGGSSGAKWGSISGVLSDQTDLQNALNSGTGNLPNQTIGGCGVEYTSGLNITVGACSYSISSVAYTSVLTNLTFAAADMSNPRIDAVIVDTTGSASILTGTPAVNPLQPTIDPATQLDLTFMLIPAASSVPLGVSATTVFDENTEWTCSSSAPINCASTNNPYHGTKDAEATNAVLGNNITLVKPAAGTLDLSTQNYLTFYIKSKAAWPTGNSGAQAARYLSIFWLNGTTQVGNQILLRDGAFGFNSSTTGAYQQVNIPVGLFQTGSNLVTSLKILVSGNTGTSSFGWYIDEVTIQGGTSPPAQSANSLIRTVGATFGSFQAGAPVLSAAATACAPIYFSGTIQAVEVISDVVGSVTVDVRTIAHSSWAGTSSPTSIAASAIPTLSSAARYTDLTLTGWNKTIIAGTDICFALTNPTTVAGVTITLKVAVN